MAAVSKSILTASTVAFALMFGGGVYVITQLNTLAKPMAERIASETLGVNVTIGSLDVFLKERRAMASDIRIANPSGFIKPHIMSIDDVDITLTSIAPKLVDFADIEASGVNLFLEVQSQTTNIHELRKLIAAKREVRLRETTSPAEGEEKPLHMIVRRFAVTDGTLNPSAVLFAEEDLEPVKLKPVVVSNVGTTENGLPAREATAKISNSVLNQLTAQALDGGFYKGLSAEALKSIGVNQIEQLKNEVTDEIDRLGDGLKSLFSKD